MANYQPPKQGGTGQIIDSLFVLALVYISLYIPIAVDFDSESDTAVVVEEVVVKEAVTWESLGQNETMQAQWEKLNVNIDDAAVIINDRFDYTINPVSLILTILVIVGYFLFLFIVSDKEYKEVIEEKFNQS